MTDNTFSQIAHGRWLSSFFIDKDSQISKAGRCSKFVALKDL